MLGKTNVRIDSTYLQHFETLKIVSYSFEKNKKKKKESENSNQILRKPFLQSQNEQLRTAFDRYRNGKLTWLSQYVTILQLRIITSTRIHNGISKFDRIHRNTPHPTSNHVSSPFRDKSAYSNLRTLLRRISRSALLKWHL